MPTEMTQRLKRMLKQVKALEKKGEFREALESGSGGHGGPEIESRTVDPMAEQEATFAIESLDAVARDEEIDEQNRVVLEAIVMPFHRPVVDVINNAMTVTQLTSEWTHLSRSDVRQRIENTFLSIGRVEIPGHPSLPYAGSGFVVGKLPNDRHLLMTNRHVAEIFATGLGLSNLNFLPGQQVEVDFLKEFGRTESESLQVNRVVMIHPYWDMALLEVSGLPTTRQPLSLLVDDPLGLQGREVVTVGYPGHDPTGDMIYQQTQARIFRGTYFVKRMQPGLFRVRGDIKSFGRKVSAVTHDCSTLGGNSGSAVIDVTTANVVGLHFAGAYLLANFAVSPYDLAQDSRVVDAGVNFAGRLPASDFYGQVWSANGQAGSEQPGDTLTTGTMMQSPAVAAIKPIVTNSRIVSTSPPTEVQSSTIEVEIPIRLKISVGVPQAIGTPSTVIAPTNVAPINVDSPVNQPQDSSSDVPPGYDTAFLAKLVPLPELSSEQISDAVSVDGSNVIPYTHFSVCQSKSRRLPRFVAWNIDGSKLKSVSRNGIDFRVDERIPSEFQVGNELYHNNDYDRGHVARRADLVWGSLVEAKKANRDSFFYTNITPQHKRFNQSALSGLWGELENAIFEDVDVHDLRISVIAGPIFKDGDPRHRGVQIPRDFWKVIAFQDDSDNQFKVAAYILSQSELVPTEALELEAFKLHQVTLIELSSETGLNFDSLMSFETLSNESEGVGLRIRREVGSREQLLAWKPNGLHSANPMDASPRTTRRTSPSFDMGSLSSTGFSWETAYAMSLCSQLAYEPPASVRHIAKETWGFNSVQFIEAGDTQCFVASSPFAIVVSFRGSESVSDWITNLTLFSTTRSYGSIHSGFASAFDLVKLAVRAQLANSSLGTRKLLLTGHSLGGALATIAAAEFQNDFNISGIYTFGQPRVGKANFRTFVASNFGQRLFRIVNDDDVVARVPPGYEHVGTLFHLGADGSLIEGALEAVGGASEPAALTESEFRELQESLSKTRQVARVEAAATEDRAIIMATMEGLFPSLSDHKLDRYVSKVRRLAMQVANSSDTGLESTRGPGLDPAVVKPNVQATIQYQKIESSLELSNQLEAANIANESVRSAVAGNRGPGGSPVLLRLKDHNWSAPAGVKIHSRIGQFATAHCTGAQLEVLRNDPGVLSVEASRDAGLPEVALSMPFIGATQVHVPPLGETGENAIIGLIDTGIDILHEAFLDAQGKTRILGIWNQRETALPGSDFKSPHATDPIRFSQDYGVLYLKEKIDEFINGIINPVPVVLRDPGPNNGPGHGTHVCSIAAGRSAGAFAGGVAPSAKILAVIPNMVTNPTDPPSLGYSNSHVDALSFLIAASKAPAIGNGMPIAINVSLGMNAGAHDGLSTLEATFDAATNKGRDPGIAIVKSAGNEGDSSGHAELQAFNGTQEITWQSSGTFRQRDYIEVWYGWQHELEFTLISPSNHTSPIVSAANTSVPCDLGGNFCTIVLTENHPDCGDHRLQVTIVPHTNIIQAGVWRLRVTGLAVGGGNQSVHAWVERDNARAVQFQTGNTNAATISIPGTAEHIITVSASGSGLPLTLTNSSSRGLTRDGRAKPDICAPGTDIIAAASNSNNRSEVVAMTGTSMASPHVAGAVALAMSLRIKLGRSQLNANQLRALLKRHATGLNGAHNPSFGFGGLNVQAFLTAVSNMP